MKKRLCYFINSAWYFKLHWLERAQAAYDCGYQVYIIARFADDRIKDELEISGFICIESDIDEKNTNPILFLHQYFKIANILDEINPDILHSITIKPGILSCLWSRNKRVKLVYSFTGLGRVFEKNTLFFKISKVIVILLYRYLLKKIDYRLIFEHAKDQEKIIKLLKIPEDRTAVIDGAGVNINHFGYQEEPCSDKPVVLFAARMLWSKGLQHLIAAKKLLQKEGIYFDINVAGFLINNDKDGISREQIEEWHNSGEIVWLGERSDINHLIAKALIIILPSTYPEGIPRILLEAGAVGRPSIVFNNDGCNSLIKDSFNGYIVDSVEQLAERIHTLLMDSAKRKSMGQNARLYVSERYSSTVVIEKTLSIYSKLI